MAPRPGPPVPFTIAPLRVPPPPTTLTPAAFNRLVRAEGRIGQAATENATLPPARDNVDSSRAAVPEPAQETEARAAQSVVTALDDRPAPSPEIEQLCERMRRIIREHRPADEESLVQARPDEMAREAGGQVSGAVEGDGQRVAGQYDAMQSPPAGTPGSTPAPLPAQPGPPPPVDAQASTATPDPVAAQRVSLANDVADSQSQMNRAGMNSPAAQLVQNGPIAEARQAQGELQQAAARSPAEVMAEQRAAIARASRDMGDLQARARQALASARTTTVGATTAQQRGMVQSEGDLRTRIGQQAQTIFDAAQRDVEQLLQPLAQTALARWEAGVTEISQQFKDRLARVKRWIDERHAGVGGFFVAIGDAVTGLPGWVTDEYDAAETLFADRTCNLLRDISRDVNAVIAACEGLIQSARQRIARLYTSLPADLQQWAQQQQAQFATRLDGLGRQATQARNSVNSDLTQRASQAVQEVREQIQTLRTEAGGVVGRIRNAVSRFLDDPVRFIINGLLDLLGIPHAAFWQCVERIRSVISQIADDPLRFASALLRGIGRGFTLFFDHFPRHLIQGFLNWLFSALPPGSGPTVPREFSLRSVVTFFLEIMGITWPRIRRILVELVGERAVAIAERVWGVLSQFIQLGPRGVWEMIKDRFNPQALVDMVIDAAVRFMVESIVTRVAARIMLLFNPVGAIAQAIEAIYRVLTWIFRNAARIFRLIEAVVNGVYDLLAGRDQAVAQAVERALAMLLPPVIDFLADYLGFGGLPRRVAQLVGELQAWVERVVLRPTLTFLVEQGRRLLAAVGIQTQRPGAAGSDAVGKTVNFTGGSESHRLWVDSNHSPPRVMVASAQPMTVTQRLDWFANNLNQVVDADQRGIATGLIPRARALTTTADNDADRRVREFRQARTQAMNAAPPAADAAAVEARLENEEDQLAAILSELFRIFDIPPGTPDGSLGNPFWIAWHKPSLSPSPSGYPELDIVDEAGARKIQPSQISDVTVVIPSAEARRRIATMTTQVDNKRTALATLVALEARTDPAAIERARTEYALADAAIMEVRRKLAEASLPPGRANSTPEHARWRVAEAALDRAAVVVGQLRISLPSHNAYIAQLQFLLTDYAAQLAAADATSVRRTERLGITATNQPFVGKVVGPRTSGTARLLQDTMKEFLRDAGYIVTSSQRIDHVIDLSIGGPDSFANLWPIAAPANFNPNQNIYLRTGKDAALGPGAGDTVNVSTGRGQFILNGKYFIIKRV